MSDQDCRVKGDRQAEAYERRLRPMLSTPCPVMSCQGRDVGVEFPRFIIIIIIIYKKKLFNKNEALRLGQEIV